MGCCSSKSVPSIRPPKHFLSENLVVQRKTGFQRDYDIVKQIGEGSISNIYCVRKKHTSCSVPGAAEETGQEGCCAGHLYAVKEIDASLVKPEYLDEMRNEIEIMRKLDHPNILKVYGVYEDEQKHIAIVMELCSGGDLTKRLPYTEDQARKIIAKIVYAVNYLHKRSTMHRDLKPENIMFESDSPLADIKLIDFGLALRYKKGDVHSDRVGTVTTMSPEVLRGEYNQSADIWSIGVIAYQLLSGKLPFQGKDRKSIARKVFKADYNFDGPEWKKISKQAKDFIKCCLRLEAKLRWTAEQALRSPWLTDVLSQSTKLLQTEIARQVCCSPNTPANSEFRRLALQAVARRTSSNEVTKLRDMFYAMDERQDGTITLAELKRGLCEHCSEEEIEAWFRRLDVDEDNRLDYTEFLAGVLETQGNIHLDHVAEAFQTFDRDNSGYISHDNLRSILGIENRSYVDQLIAEADTAKDGKLSFQEFRDVLLSHQKADMVALKEEE